MKKFLQQTKQLWLEDILDDTTWLLHLYIPVVLVVAIVIATGIVMSIFFGSK